jgi:hypothetical protein
MKHKVWSISLCYNDPKIIEESLNQLQVTRDKENVEMIIVMVDQHWPIDREKNKKEIERIALKNSAILLDPGKNLGLHHGFNWAFNQLHIPDNAMVIGFDPDSWPVVAGWDKSMCDVFVADPSIIWLSLWHPHATRELLHENKSKPESVIAGHRVVEVSAPVMNSVCGFRAGFLKKSGGLTEPSKYYGGLECSMWEKVKAHGKWVFLPDYKEELHFQDVVNPLYRDWKWEHAHKEYPHDFTQFLKERGVELAL